MFNFTNTNNKTSEQWKYWLDKSEENFKSCEVLMRVNYHASAMSRLYYSVFVLGYAEITNYVPPEEDTCVHSRVLKHFEKMIDKEKFKLFTKLLKKRKEADYHLKNLDSSECQELFKAGRKLRQDCQNNFEKTGRVAI